MQYIEIATTHQEYPGAVVLTTTKTTTDTKVFRSFDEAKRGLRRIKLVEEIKAVAPLLAGAGVLFGGIGFLGNADGDVKKTLVGVGLSIGGGVIFGSGNRRAGESAQREEIIADQLGYIRDLTMPTEEATEAGPQNTPFL